MSQREQIADWIGGDYNRRHEFDHIFSMFPTHEETHTDLTEIIQRLDADEAKMNAFNQAVAENTENEVLTCAEWCFWMHNEIDDIWAELDAKADYNHIHSYNDLTDLPALFDGTWPSLSGKPSTFTPSAHIHPMSDITNLQTELDGKIAKSPKASARANVATGTGGLAVTVLGLSVVGANALTRLDEYGVAINDILSRLRTRDIIAT